MLNAETVIRGTLTGKGVMEIRGRVEGDIDHDGTLIIAAGAHCVSNIRAHQLEIAGEVRGNVEVQGKLEIRHGGILHGDATCSKLTIQAGGALNGRNSMLREESSPQVKAAAHATQEVRVMPSITASSFVGLATGARAADDERPGDREAAGSNEGFKGRPGVKGRFQPQPVEH